MNEPALSLSGKLRDELARVDTSGLPVRFSHLKAMARSAAHCRHAMIAEDEPTLAKRIGSGVHSLLLGGQPLVAYPGKQRRGKDYESFAAANPGALIYLTKDYDRSHRIADAVRAHEQASAVLFGQMTGGTDYEKTLYWNWLGRSRRCTPDVRSYDHLAELKSTRNASPDKFRWDVLRFGYHAQLADYRNAIETVYGKAPREVFIVAVEQLPPFVVSVYRLTANDLEMGAVMCRGWMERLLVCEQAGRWPGYCEAIQDLDLPSNDDTELVFGDEPEATTEGDAQ